MKKLVIVLLVSTVLSSSCVQKPKMVNRQIPIDKQKEQFDRDYRYCLEHAYKAFPDQQIRINSQGQNTLQSNPAAYWSDMTNMASFIGTNLNRNRAIWSCMGSKGWEEQPKEEIGFLEYLDKQMPKWREIQGEPDFKIWLSDFLLEQKYREAFNNFNHEIIIAILQKWEDEKRNIEKGTNSKGLKDWLVYQPEYFSKIADTGSYHQKRILLREYQLENNQQKSYSLKEIRVYPPKEIKNPLPIIQMADEAYDSGDIRKAFYYYGGLSLRGYSIPDYYALSASLLYKLKEYDLCALWEMKAARLYDPGCLVETGRRLFYEDYKKDRITPQDIGLAYKYFLSAAEQGDSLSQYYLATILSKFKDKQFDRLTYYYLKLASLQNCESAQALYTFYLSDGIFFPKDYYNAYKWMCIAQANNSRLNEVFKRGFQEKLEAFLTKQEIKKAQKEATEFVKRQREKKDFYIVVMYPQDSNSAYISCSRILPEKYAEIMSKIHQEQYKIIGFFKTDSDDENWYLYNHAIKEWLIKHHTNATTYKIKKEELIKNLERISECYGVPLYLY